VILDCGYGTFGSFRDLGDDARVRAIVVSHAHRDHYADLNEYLAYASAPRDPFEVIASVDTFDGLSHAGEMFDATRVVVNDHSRVRLDPFVLEFSTTTHQIPTLGVRASVGDSHVVYSADTGPGWLIPASWRRPGLAILECTYSKDDQAPWPYHLSSHDVAELAEELDATTTLITHVPPHVDSAERLREVRQAAPSRLFVLAESGWRAVVAPDED
jgi:ribonuclease BN (tRNA processing enzyme)